jgi:acyl carrier protein
MRTLEQTTNEILELATKHFKLESGSLKAEDDFYKKLGIDSLQNAGNVVAAGKPFQH